MKTKESTVQSKLLTKAFNNAWITLYKKAEDDNIPYYYNSRDMQLNFIEI